MVSRRNFFSILIMMATILFMFQFSQMVRESLSDYDVNIYTGGQRATSTSRWQQTGLALNRDTVYESGDFVVFFGDEESKLGNVVMQWCNYTKRNIVRYDKVEKYKIDEEHMPEAVLVDATFIDVTEKLDYFEELTNYNIVLVFCNLPAPAVIREDRELRALLGIQEVRADEIEAEGIHLFGDFLLGGETFYEAETEEDAKRQDMELNMPWYVTSGGTKTYMVGILDELLDDVEEKNEIFPALIWRNSHGNAKVFAVNGDYMEDIMGIGILSAMMYEAGDYTIYPVVNAQNILIMNFPGFAKENDEQMMRLYSRDTDGVMRDIFWPTLSGLTDRNLYRPTCFLTAQYDYSDDIEPTGEKMAFYLQQFKEFHTEAALSMQIWDDTDIEDKLDRDEQFYLSLEEQYNYSAVYVKNEKLRQFWFNDLIKRELLQDVITVASGYDEDTYLMSYFSNTVTLQAITNDLSAHTYTADLRLRCIQTALAYTNVQIDMYQALWPESPEQQWENLADTITSNLNTYWSPFSDFDRTTLSESDAKVRNFLNVDYAHRREGDTVYLEAANADESWFLLRVHGESISGITGGTYKEIEQGTYLICVNGDESVEIRLSQSRGLLQFDVARAD